MSGGVTNAGGGCWIDKRNNPGVGGVFFGGGGGSGNSCYLLCICARAVVVHVYVMYVCSVRACVCARVRVCVRAWWASFTLTTSWTYKGRRPYCINLYSTRVPIMHDQNDAHYGTSMLIHSCDFSTSCDCLRRKWVLKTTGNFSNMALKWKKKKTTLNSGISRWASTLLRQFYGSQNVSTNYT